MATPFTLSKDNIELQFATNHLGHFLLTNLLLETMKKTAHESGREGRIVILSSEAHRYPYREGIRFDKIKEESSYSGMYAYGQSKLANILHVSELARRLKVLNLNVHPLLNKFIDCIGIANAVGKYVLKNIQQVKGVSGEYFVDNNKSNPTSLANDVELAKKLWEFSLSLTDPN